MGASHGRSKSVTQTPPPGSRLALYAGYFEALSASGPPAWQSEHQALRVLAVADELRAEPRLHLLPYELVRDAIVVPALVAMGMPSGPRPPWLEGMIDDETYLVREHSKMHGPRSAGRRAGRPGPAIIPYMVFSGAFIAALTYEPALKNNNQVYEAVLKRLGPGTDRDQVRRVYLDFLQTLGPSTGPYFSLRVAAARCCAELMRKFDAEAPDKLRKRA